MILRRTIPIFLFIIGIMWLLPTRSASQGMFRLYVPSVYSGIALPPDEPILLYETHPLSEHFRYQKLTTPDMQQHWRLHNDPVGGYPTHPTALAPNGQTVLFTNTGIPRVNYAIRTNGTYLRHVYIVVGGWSPDSTMTATIANSSLYYAPIGQPARRIAGDVSYSGWLWSADSKGIVYTALREDVLALYYYDLERGEERLLYDEGRDPYVVAAIPDGRFLVAMTDGIHTYIVRIEADGSNAAILLTIPKAYLIGISPKVDPTGRFFVLKGAGLPTRVYTMEGEIVWEVPEFCAGSPCGLWTVSWRGDGNELAYDVRFNLGNGEGYQYRIFLIKTDGSETDPRLVADLASTPFFSPDGRYLAYKGRPTDQSASTTLHIRDLLTEDEVVLRDPDADFAPIGWFYSR
jgi:Tol biopolymer transport system component